MAVERVNGDAFTGIVKVAVDDDQRWEMMYSSTPYKS